MLSAGILGFMLPGDPEEVFSADPPIQRCLDRVFTVVVSE